MNQLTAKLDVLHRISKQAVWYSCRPHTARTTKHVDAVEALVLSQEDRPAPGTHPDILVYQEEPVVFCERNDVIIFSEYGIFYMLHSSKFCMFKFEQP